jgi:uncharacterized damage-inducible protein DinB
MPPVLGPAEARLILELSGLPSLRLEHVLTRRVIAAIPPDHASYRPQAGARSADELARHIVGAELRFLGGAATGEFPDFRDRLNSMPDLPSVVRLYETEFPPALEKLQQATGDQLLRMLDYRGLVKMPALAFVQLALNHTIHHRGQLSVYLREVGVPVPAIYG